MTRVNTEGRPAAQMTQASAEQLHVPIETTHNLQEASLLITVEFIYLSMEDIRN
jgi:hypothetical protein